MPPWQLSRGGGPCIIFGTRNRSHYILPLHIYDRYSHATFTKVLLSQLTYNTFEIVPRYIYHNLNAKLFRYGRIL